MPNYYRLQVESLKKSSDLSFSATVQKSAQSSTHNSKKQKRNNLSKILEKFAQKSRLLCKSCGGNGFAKDWIYST